MEVPTLGSETVSEWDHWMDAFYEYADLLPNEDVVKCPNCGARTLRLVFVGPPGLRVGFGFFWCATCLTGLFLHRMEAPSKVPIISAKSDDPRLLNIPNFRPVQ
jgi:hypothetical protein